MSALWKKHRVHFPSFQTVQLLGSETRSKVNYRARIHIMEQDNESVGISWTCSRDPLRRDQDCRYSRSTRNREADEQYGQEQAYEEEFS